MSLCVSAWQGYWEEDIPAKLSCTNISFQQEELPAHRQEFPHLSRSSFFSFFAAFPLHTLSDTASHLLPLLLLSHEHSHMVTHTHTKPHLSRYSAHTCCMLPSCIPLTPSPTGQLCQQTPLTFRTCSPLHLLTSTYLDRAYTLKARRVH